MSSGLGLRRSPEMSGKIEKAVYIAKTSLKTSHLKGLGGKELILRTVQQNLCWLEEKEKEVVSALRYFKTIVDKMAIDKKVLEMLPGSASKVLEAILPLVQTDPRIQHSSALSSCYSRVYQSLANLIRWSDQVMLEGVNSEDKEMVTTVKGVIKAVLDGVKWRDSPPLGSSEEIMCSKRSSAEEKNTWASQIVAAYLTQEGGFLRQVSQEEWQEREGTADRDSGQCSRNTSCETLDHYDPDYEFLQQDLSNADQTPPQAACSLSPLPESLGEAGPPFLGHPLQLPLGSCPQQEGQQTDTPPALPEKKRRSAASQTTDSSGCKVSYERHPSQYDNISEDDLQNPVPVQPVPYTPFAAILPFQQGTSSAPVEFVGDFSAPESAGDPEKPPPLPEKKNKHMLAYMQLLEDYSEPQPSMFYQTPQSEHIYQQKNRMLMEVYGFSDAFCGSDSLQELAPPPALPPKQRQLASYAASSFSVSYCVQQTKVAFTPEDGSAAQGLSVSVSNSFLNRHGSLPVPSSSDLAVPTVSSPPPSTVDGPLSSSQDSSFHGNPVRLPSETSFTDSSENATSEEVGGGDYVNLYSSGQTNKELAPSRGEPPSGKDGHLRDPSVNSASGKDSRENGERPGTLHDFHSHEIAEQLTLLDAELFYKIEIPEVLLWAKEQNEEKSPNLTQFTEHFNNMSYWVRSIIMLQEKAQDRERLLLKFIKIMKHLRKLNNFNSYLAILSALDSAPIRRLEWQRQTSEGLAEYCTLIDSSSSFRAYRAALSEVEPPCIPYLGLILQDLTFVHLGNPDYIDGKVNFSKRWQQFNILDSMRCFQQAHYEIRRNDDIINFFNDFSDHLAEEALWELSLKIKPRNITRRKTDREEKT
ncbi:Rap guanine nucleotide exchange factor (GEF) 1 [Cricetulus griseus]